MRLSRLRKSAALLLVGILTSAGLFFGEDSASATAQYNVNVGFRQSADEVDGGTANDYEVTVHNVGERQIRDLKLYTTLGDNVYGLEFVNPEQPCDLYRHVASDQAPELVQSFNCFETQELKSPKIWQDSMSASLQADLADLDANQEVRIKLRAYAPYNVARIQHDVSVSSPLSLGGNTRITVGQSVRTRPFPRATIQEKFEALTASEKIVPGQPNDSADVIPKGVFRATYTHVDGGSIYNFRSTPYVSVPDGAFQGSNLMRMKCNSELSTPGICERAILKSHYVDPSKYERPYIQGFDYVNPGDRIVLDIEVAPRMRCVEDPDGQYYLRVSGRDYSAHGNTVSLRQGKSQVVAELQPPACAPTPVTVELTELNNGQPVQAGVPASFTLSFKNHGDVDVLRVRPQELGIKLGLTKPSRRYDAFSGLNKERIQLLRRVTCETGEGLYCPENFKPSVKKDIISNVRDYFWNPETIALVPAGKEVRLKFEYTFEFLHCFQGEGYTAGQPITDLKFYTEVKPKVDRSVNTSPVLFTPSHIDHSNGVPILGASACGGEKPTLHVKVTPKDDQPLLMGSSFGKTFHVVIENRSNIDYYRGLPQVYFALPEPPRGSAYAWQGSAKKTPDGERSTYTGYGSSYGGERKLYVMPERLIRDLEDMPISLPAYDPQNPAKSRYEFDVRISGAGINGERQHKCPVSRGKVFNGDGTPADFNYEPGRFRVGFEVNKKDPYANYVVEADSFEGVCNNMDLTFNRPGEHVAPGEVFTTVMQIQNRMGYAHKLPFQMRFPIGSAVFPKEALGKNGSLGPDLFSSDKPASLDGLLTCEGSNGGRCEAENISASISVSNDQQGNRFYLLQGVVNQLSEGQTLTLKLKPTMGVVPTVGSGYKATAIIGSHGDMDPGHSSFYGEGSTSDHTQISWAINNDKVDFGWSNTVSYQDTPPNSTPSFSFEGSLYCPASQYEQGSFTMTVPAGQLNTPKVQQNVAKYWFRDQCEFTASSPSAPEGYLWKAVDPAGGVSYYKSDMTQTQSYTVSTKDVRNYAFNWTLVKAPKIISKPVNGRLIDPCGPNNAFWEEPVDKAGFTWMRNGDGSVDVVALDGFAFQGDKDTEFLTRKHFDAPVDSGMACPNIRVKGSGVRVAGSGDQFTLAWQQTEPVSALSRVSVSSNIVAGSDGIAFESAPVETVNGAVGEVVLSTSPVDAVDGYEANLKCSYEGEGSRPVYAMVKPGAVESGRVKWLVTVPDTNRLVTCEAAIKPGQGVVRVLSRDGGYEGDSPASGSDSLLGSQGWTIYPESSVAGRPDMSKGRPGDDSGSSVFTFDGLKPGVYYLERSQTPQGYVDNSVRVQPASGVEVVTLGQGDERKSYVKLTVSSGSDQQITVFSQRQLGALDFHKVSAVDPSLFLAGSEWRLSSVDGGVQSGQSLAGEGALLVDCVADSAVSCSGLDRNPLAGQFSVVGLKWGEYALTETKAPVGFRLPAQAGRSKVIRVGASGLHPSFVGDSAIVNDQAGVPNIPHTGGLGRDYLIISGVVLLVIAGGATVWLMRRSYQLSLSRLSA